MELRLRPRARWLAHRPVSAPGSWSQPPHPQTPPPPTTVLIWPSATASVPHGGGSLGVRGTAAGARPGLLASANASAPQFPPVTCTGLIRSRQTTLMLHQCRGSGIDAPSMPLAHPTELPRDTAARRQAHHEHHPSRGGIRPAGASVPRGIRPAGASVPRGHPSRGGTRPAGHLSRRAPVPRGSALIAEGHTHVASTPLAVPPGGGGLMSGA
jgi:hypothetical protein